MTGSSVPYKSESFVGQPDGIDACGEAVQYLIDIEDEARDNIRITRESSMSRGRVVRYHKGSTYL